MDAPLRNRPQGRHVQAGGEVTTTEQRAIEAQRIAEAEQFSILSNDPDWTFFTLDDGQTVNDTRGQWPNIRIVGTKVIHTHFEWDEESGRFEGFVS